ncbi:hypothetical protein GCM10009117_00820 [Gangjinia marincola]|uniref:Uncharacterized protein n=1 Tax=Gangjinia marincola TaxID=578463 RepID=A0ABN1MCW0_9FLAO
MDQQTVQEGKTTAVIAYIFFIGGIIAVFMNIDSKNKFAAFHIRQAVGIHLTYFLFIFIISNLDSWLISTCFILIIMTSYLYGIVNAAQGKANLLPVVGTYFQQWFKTFAP